MFAEFKEFLLKTNAMALAIGVIIGIALGSVVTSLVNDIIMPPIGILLGGVDFSKLVIELKAATADADAVTINWGLFVNSIITFVVVAIVVFWIGKVMIREKPAAPAEPTEEVKLLTEIRDSLRKS